ncbi:nucleotidyltransferase domain-containing protein [Pseudonocardia adelaidensis]|uniref:nucleotidyltransferase domain-containing protein n=1 Tax=Pseudonocardia adelaidensis TaxID=648754 RepID=UPI0031E747B6
MAPQNVASIAVARRLGMHRDGALRERYLHRGTRYDAEVWSLFAPEWLDEQGGDRVFTEGTRGRLQETLLDRARRDGRIAAAALVGSTASGRQDRWSDIDLALRVGANVDRDAVVADRTDLMRREHSAVDHLDVIRADTLYRVFLRADTLQVDISFWPFDRFRPTGPRFVLVFGEALDGDVAPPAPATRLVGWTWLHALHARPAIGPGRIWQAEHMIGGMREHVIALACLRHDLATVQGRGVDDLPRAVTAPLAATLVRSPDPAEVHRAFAATCALLVDEVALVDEAVAARVGPVLEELVGSAAPDATRHPRGS